MFAGDSLAGLTSPSDLSLLLSKMDPGTLSTLLGAPAGPLLEDRAASLLSMEQVSCCSIPGRPKHQTFHSQSVNPHPLPLKAERAWLGSVRCLGAKHGACLQHVLLRSPVGKLFPDHRQCSRCGEGVASDTGPPYSGVSSWAVVLQQLRLRG